MLGTLTWAVPSTDRQCPDGQECRNRFQCPNYQDKQAQLKLLTKGSTEYENLFGKLKNSICNLQERAVCCAKNYELVGGTEVTDNAEYPFMVYIRVRTGLGTSVECGASLVTEQFLISSSHCLGNFYEDCYQPGKCFASFRKLNKQAFQEGEFKIDLLDVVEGPGKSDLTLIKLVMPVSDHPDYSQGLPLVPVTLATEPPRVGEAVYTVGWGRTGFKDRRGSDQLMALNLTVQNVEDQYIFTKVTDVNGDITDPCDGRLDMCDGRLDMRDLYPLLYH